MGASMIRAFMAILLLDAGLCPILLADGSRGLHWAEGIYFPPAIPQAGARRNATRYGNVPGNASGYSYRSNPWAVPGKVPGKDGVYRQPQTLESLGYPSEQYDPYRSAQPGASGFPHRDPVPGVSLYPRRINPYFPRPDYPASDVEIYNYGTQPARRAQPYQPKGVPQGEPFATQPSVSPSYGLDNDVWPPPSYSPYDRESRSRGYRMPESGVPPYSSEYGSRYYDPSYRGDRYTPRWGIENYWNDFNLGTPPFPGMWPSLSTEHYYPPLW